MANEKNLVPMTILVEVTAGCRLDHVCARCGVTARSTPNAFDTMDYETGRSDGEIFRVRSAIPPAGWEYMRITHAEGNGTKHVEVCPECVRAFFRSLMGEPSEIQKLHQLLERVLADARISGADQVSDETRKDIRAALARR